MESLGFDITESHYLITFMKKHVKKTWYSNLENLKVVMYIWLGSIFKLNFLQTVVLWPHDFIYLTLNEETNSRNISKLSIINTLNQHSRNVDILFIGIVFFFFCTHAPNSVSLSLWYFIHCSQTVRTFRAFLLR